MKRFFIPLFLLIFGVNAVYAAPLKKIKVNKVLNSLRSGGKIKVQEYEKNGEWTWVEADFFDEEGYPLTVDVLLDNADEPSRVVYLVSPSGYNFKGNFFTPRNRNIAHFMRMNDYLVIGITFREDHLPPDYNDQYILEWDLEKHRLDMHKIITLIKCDIHLPYELLGQSSSAICILDYAANYSDPGFEKITILDTDSFDPYIQPEKVLSAGISFDAANQLIEQGIYTNPFAKNFKELISAAMLYPDADSGQPRPNDLAGNFTFSGLLHFSLIFTAYLPGLYTPITGLPGEWTMVQGAASGYYNFNPQDPLYDDFVLDKTDVQILSLVAEETGEGLTPLAFERDIYAVLALNGAYTIDWSGIQEKVVMINGELSSGYQTYYGTQIQDAGNTDVIINVIPGYAYIDILYGTDAEQDVWFRFLD